jgi:hypothetical protein
MNSSVLLTMEATINLTLGLFLGIFPKTFVAVLSIPNSNSAFYLSILGAVLFGIGVALLLERFRGSGGLGLLGAISINLSGGIVPAVWLLSGRLSLPLHGVVILWGLVLLLLGDSGFELLVRTSHR